MTRICVAIGDVLSMRLKIKMRYLYERRLVVLDYLYVTTEWPCVFGGAGTRLRF